jgi:hypothetical protein
MSPLQSKSTDLAMALSPLSIDKANIAPSSSSLPDPSPSSSSDLLTISPVNEGLNKNRKRKREDCSNWFRFPLEDITHLFHPNIDNSKNDVMSPNASPLHWDAPIERRIVVAKRRVLKQVERKPTVSLRKEFR